MVDIAQSVEHLIVVQEVACSSHVIHPGRGKPERKFRLFAFLPNIGVIGQIVCLAFLLGLVVVSVVAVFIQSIPVS